MNILFKIPLLLTLLIFTNNNFSQNVFIAYEGYFQGENLYIQNPFTGNGIGYCVDSVLVNGKRTEDSISFSAFEIGFSMLELKTGDPVSVIVYHKIDCLPKVLNPRIGQHGKNVVKFTKISVE